YGDLVIYGEESLSITLPTTVLLSCYPPTRLPRTQRRIPPIRNVSELEPNLIGQEFLVNFFSSVRLGWIACGSAYTRGASPLIPDFIRGSMYSLLACVASFPGSLSELYLKTILDSPTPATPPPNWF